MGEDSGGLGGDTVAVEECQKLIESMPRRIQAVLKAKGGYTKY
jgi:hypothetical protein